MGRYRNRKEILEMIYEMSQEYKKACEESMKKELLEEYEKVMNDEYISKAQKEMNKNEIGV